MSFDFSRRPELTSLALVVRDLHQVAQPMDTAFFLIGAAARDLMLREAHGIDTGRQTKDVDFSVMVDGWESFSALRKGLLTAGAFAERDDQATGARLLGRDMALLLDNPAVDRVLQILRPQADEQGPLLMAKQSGMAMEAARKLIHAVCIGLVDMLPHRPNAASTPATSFIFPGSTSLAKLPTTLPLRSIKYL
jgi:predicted nucleotidyltransferase